MTDRPRSRARPRSESRATAVACRALDIVGAPIMLVLLAPVFALIAVAIRLDSPGRAIFRQRRVGRGRRRSRSTSSAR